TNYNEANKGSKTGTREENELLTQKGKARDGNDNSESYSPLETSTKLACEGGGRIKCKRKIPKGNNYEINEESPSRFVQRKLVDYLSPCKMLGGELKGRSEGLAMSWEGGADVVIQRFVGGDFNAIIDDAEKEGGHKKSRVDKEEFKDVLEELALVDIKADRGWFTWVNNSEGNDMVKEKPDHFVMSANAITDFPFISPNMIRQANLD
ncbi:hypothetical protein Goarm_018954, partial [Gossypium armourianum]|nr:hypothetical protein [Gossypium armourianum]